MSAATRTTKTFSLEKEVLREVERTKGSASTSERVNELLKVALLEERRKSLHTEAADFFRTIGDDRSAEKAFQSAAIRTIARD